MTTRVDRLAPATVRSLGVAAASCVAMLLPAAEARAEANVEMRDTCFFAVPEDGPALDFECGYVVLPENPVRADGPEVRLGFLRLPARGEATAAPLFMLAGGPGQSLIAPSSMLLFSDAFLGPLPDASRYARAYGISALEGYLDFCAAIDVPPLPDSTDTDVTTDVPTLILAGALDARTPAIRSELVAENLPRATIVVFPGGTHVQLGEANLCAGDILQAFLADPNAAPDTGCIAQMPRRGFVLPDGTMSLE